MDRVIPPAHVVLTTRWVIATIIRVWVLLTVVQNIPGPFNSLKQAIHRSIQGESSPFGGAPGTMSPPFLDVFGIGHALVDLIFSCVLYIVAAIWAGSLAKLVAPTSAKCMLSKPGIGWPGRLRQTAWWWASVLLRLWALRMFAFLVLPLWSAASNHLQYIRQLREGGLPIDGMRTTFDVIWHGALEAIENTWVSSAIALFFWFGASVLGRLLTREPAANSCPTCGYGTTASSCPECGTPLNPPSASDPPAASPSPAPPHPPPAAGA